MGSENSGGFRRSWWVQKVVVGSEGSGGFRRSWWVRFSSVVEKFSEFVGGSSSKPNKKKMCNLTISLIYLYISTSVHVLSPRDCPCANISKENKLLLIVKI